MFIPEWVNGPVGRDVDELVKPGLPLLGGNGVAAPVEGFTLQLAPWHC